jgi:DNA invertase Pin-like site-specific DNA recombinase
MSSILASMSPESAVERCERTVGRPMHRHDGGVYTAPITHEEAREASDAGYSVAQIAKAFGVCRDTVERRLRKRGDWDQSGYSHRPSPAQVKEMARREAEEQVEIRRHLGLPW